MAKPTINMDGQQIRCACYCARIIQLNKHHGIVSWVHYYCSYIASLDINIEPGQTNFCRPSVLLINLDTQVNIIF